MVGRNLHLPGARMLLLNSSGLGGEMMHINTVRESNAQCKDIEGLVTVFVGGTGGIGESTAKELFLRTKRPKAYIVGRSEEQGNRICNELHEINEYVLLHEPSDSCHPMAYSDEPLS